MRNKLVMVFGVFDLLHPGHVSFLKQASSFAKATEDKRELIVVVARDAVVEQLKHKKPHFNERERAAHIRKEFNSGVRVALGDRKLGTYSAIRRYKPDCICVGYDQRQLLADLRERMRLGTLPQTRIVRLNAHKPRRYHTSLFSNS